jgi:NADH-quinone oxidoreductase subunit M
MAVILVLLIGLPLLGGLAALAAGDRRPRLVRWLSVIVLIADLVLALTFWGRAPLLPADGGGAWMAVLKTSWIPVLGISFQLGIDGLSLLMVLLTILLGLLSVGCSWSEITERVAFFHFNLLWILAGIMGVFLALDLFLFYLFWELMLVPMYFLIGIWGHENRLYASVKFFIFTQGAGLLMLLAILGLAFAHRQATGVLTFDYFALLDTPIARAAQMWLMLGFFVGFAVKLPAIPLHTWLPDAHTEAPTAGSVVLAGLLLKTGAYGLLRFAVPLFPEAARAWTPVAMWMGVAGILYGALMAFGQKDLKRLVAYTSVSHLGFVLLGIYAWNALALQGVVLQMIAHGLSTGGLFILVGALSERTRTRDLDQLGGLWTVVPRMGGIGMVLVMASLGLPGLVNFVAEFLILLGSFHSSRLPTIFATLGLVAATAYSLWIMQRTWHGSNERGWRIVDLGARELLVLGTMIVLLVWFGLWPQPVLDAARPVLARLQEAVAVAGTLPLE